MTAGGDEFNTTAAEIIARYRAGERLFDGVELADGDSFSGATLAGAHFHNAWLHSTDFSHADLRGAVFETACLKCIDFRSADLRDARFRDVTFCGSDFSGARIEGASTQDAGWYGAEVTDISVLVR